MRIDDEIGKVALPVPVMIYILFKYYFNNFILVDSMMLEIIYFACT